MLNPMKIYVAGPLSDPCDEKKELNIDQAVTAGRLLAEMGHYPFVPHLNEMFDVAGDPLDYEFWLDCDLAYMRCCDAVLFLGASPGALRELYKAGEWKMPVYWSIDDVPAARPPEGEPR